jgi:hypothetical protein
MIRKPRIISNTSMESLDEACTYFRQVLQEHLDKRDKLHFYHCYGRWSFEVN